METRASATRIENQFIAIGIQADRASVATKKFKLGFEKIARVVREVAADQRYARYKAGYRARLVGPIRKSPGGEHYLLVITAESGFRWEKVDFLARKGYFKPEGAVGMRVVTFNALERALGAVLAAWAISKAVL